ncbi:TonB-dependent receptor [Muricauda oceani]|uniref:TonB-dependent receptor n=1 Tax=Flagellimonas oceani TaxID=2698672 RepID=A0A6G7IZJ9_9FLAO|nr:TonB-dependent receptor [Allomuricauda oceani]MBW8243657.1 TonB-dependent receptor [Allomuricauda oceani]QII43976.1 TonB-dependent receptor [Allomuricauda oceani]
MVEATATDMDGKFSLKAKPGHYLVATGIGYIMYSEQITGNKNVYAIELKENVSTLEEVVVVGYGSTKRKDLTGSVATMKAKEIVQINSQTIDQALIGKMSGVHVSAQSGAPGSGAIVHVRGLSQLVGDNQPLYVVDGVPIIINPRVAGSTALSDNRQNPLLSINPADIERVDVLKDASSAAIYGSRAANGVVLITTKRGNRNQAPRFNFSYSATMQNPTRTYDVLNAREFREYLIEQGREDEIVFGNGDTDWQEEVTNNNALWRQYSVGISGGSDKINYLMSGHVSDQEGIMLGNKLNRYTFSSSLDADLTDRLRVGGHISYNYTDNKQSALSNLGQGAFYRPDLPVFNADGGYSFQDFSGLQRLNPLGDEAKVRSKAVAKNVLGTVYGEYQLFTGLRFRSQLSINLNNDRSDVFHPSYTRRGLENGALLFVQHSEGLSTSWSNTLNFNTTIANDHTIDALAGVSWDHSRLNLDAQSYLGFPDDEILTDINSAQTVLDVSSQATQTALNSLFGRVNYNFKDRYLATFTGRYDGSIKFGPNSRHGFFPSAALAWNVHNENFLSNSELLSQLKLRASLGRTGSDNLPAFSYLVNYLSLNGTDSYYDGVNGIAVDGVPNLDIRWEETDQLDLGLELGMFNGRMNAQVVYFEKKTSGIILFVPVPSQTGYSSWNANIADVSNKGWEIELGGDIIRAKDFRWNSSFNISFIENNVDALNNGATTNFGSTGILEGEPIGVITGYDVVSIAQTQEEIDALNSEAPSGTYYSGLVQPGDYIFRDVNGDNEITPEDITPLGDINPKYYGGWNNSLSYKNFDFSFNFNFVQGNKRNWYRGATEFSSISTTSNVTTQIYNTWTPDNTDAEYARLESATHGNTTTTSKNVKAGDYIRLRSASLSYNFPKEWLANTGIDNLRLSLSGNNLFTISDYPGIDPESVETQQGGATVQLARDTGASYPQARTITIGFNLSL